MSEPTVPKRRLVRDLMQVGVPSCAPDTPLEEITRRLVTENLDAVVVLDERGHAVGAVTRQDLLRAFSQGQEVDARAEDVMRDRLPQVPPDIPLSAAAQIMEDLHVSILYIMHHAGGIAYPAAILTAEHILRLLAAAGEEELNDLGIKAQREAPLDTFYRRRDEARRQAGLPQAPAPPAKKQNR